MLVKTYGSAIQGIEATTVTVEVNIETMMMMSLLRKNKEIREATTRRALLFAQSLFL